MTAELQIWNNSAFANPTGCYLWNGTAFVPPTGCYIWNGTAFVKVWPPPAVAYDATGGGYTGQTTGAGYNFSWTHTAAAGASVIVAVGLGASQKSSTNPRGATYGGVAMTSLGVQDQDNSTYGWVEIFGLLAASVPSGPQTVTVTGTVTSYFLVANSISYNGVGSFGAAVKNYGLSTALSSGSISSTTGQMVAQCFSMWNGQDMTKPSVSSYSETQRYYHTNSLSYQAGAATIIGDAPGASTVTFTGKTSTAVWASVAVPLIPA